MTSYALNLVFWVLAIYLSLSKPINHYGLKTGARLCVLAGIGGLLLIPISTFSLFEILYGYYSEISILSVTLLLLISMSTLKLPLNRLTINRRDINFFLGFALLHGTILYPATLGLTAYDPYSLGYQPTLLTVYLSVFALVALHLKHLSFALSIGLSLLAYYFRVFNSNNLWDYSLDVLLVLIALVYLIIIVYKQLKRRFCSST